MLSFYTIARCLAFGTMLAGMATVGNAQQGEAGNPAPTVETPTDSGPYKPRDEDERGLWLQMDEAERDLRASRFVIDDPELNAYVNGVLCRAVGEDQCKEARVYLMRTPYFNASMAPNGMMQVWSGLLLRTENEAQLAAVLAHEFTHYRQLHSVRLFRNFKEKSNTAAWLSFVPFGWVAQYGLLFSIFSFSRDMEREADAGSVAYLARAGYDPTAASRIWERMRAEMDATAVARDQKSRKDKNGGIFATHPSSEERMETLREMAASVTSPAADTGEARYRAALSDWWAELVDDQLKLNDFGASEFLLTQLASDGWTAPLLYARGELYRRRANDGDMAQAVTYYRQAATAGGDFPEIWRGLGIALLKSGAQAEGQAALRDYLRLAPDAPDRELIAMMAGRDEL